MISTKLLFKWIGILTKILFSNCIEPLEYSSNALEIYFFDNKCLFIHSYLIYLSISPCYAPQVVIIEDVIMESSFCYLKICHNNTLKKNNSYETLST